MSSSRRAVHASDVCGKVYSPWIVLFKDIETVRALDGPERPTHHAASIGLFLCSYFCSPQILDSNIKLWTEARNRSEIEKIEGVRHLDPTRFIDPLFQLNLLVIAGDRKGASTKSLDKELDILTRKITGDTKPFLVISKMKLFKWNAETLDTDFTHRTRGVSASGNSVLLELPGFADPNSSLNLQKRDVAEQLMNCVRAWRVGS